jgi:hypothetical protein
MLSYSTIGMSTPISVGVHHHRLARWYKTNNHKTLCNFSWMGHLDGPNSNIRIPVWSACHPPHGASDKKCHCRYSLSLSLCMSSLFLIQQEQHPPPYVCASDQVELCTSTYIIHWCWSLALYWFWQCCFLCLHIAACWAPSVWWKAPV